MVIAVLVVVGKTLNWVVLARIICPLVVPMVLGEIVKFPPFKVVKSASALEKVSPVFPIVLLVKICACFSNTKVSEALVIIGIERVVMAVWMPAEITVL